MSGRFLSPAREDRPDHFCLDLKEANRQILRRLDLSEAADLSLSTYRRPDLFFSARRDRITGRNIATIESIETRRTRRATKVTEKGNH
jgi:copper oxidase (laccase) domain-containing protein